MEQTPVQSQFQCQFPAMFTLVSLHYVLDTSLQLHPYFYHAHIFHSYPQSLTYCMISCDYHQAMFH